MQLASRNCCFRTRSNAMLPREFLHSDEQILRKDFSTPPTPKGKPCLMHHRMVPPGGVILQIGLLIHVWFLPSLI
ncbi:hypothetical protein T01_1769 [Trichinella spiralis]|uniref:Uncharacterized protein n=1 Tax=Trichinella spiralis TaxID=6334 RepID=A0A0V1ANU4_TRISP|nr:hypothetical protein T01_15184 [Trichinella spiralis]KRY31188.1 hypothetical protein T01_1769 [Trichinella spiralis]